MVEDGTNHVSYYGTGCDWGEGGDAERIGPEADAWEASKVKNFHALAQIKYRDLV
jgi:hypothetical protein